MPRFLQVVIVLALLVTGASVSSSASDLRYTSITGGSTPQSVTALNEVTAKDTATQITPLVQSVTAIAAGGFHTCALTSPGGVKCWGWNPFGQLGDGTTSDHFMPVIVNGLSSGVTAIVAGGGHACALTGVGGVKCWGSNLYGQLGDGTTTYRLTPVDVNGLSSGVIAIAAGDSHTCALTSAGGVKCWGYNYSGQLGDGTTTYRVTPASVSGLNSGVRAITASFQNTCALTNVGVKCWGDNYYGQLGDGTTISHLTPVDTIGLSSSVIAIVAGWYHTCALTNVGGVKCWGNNHSGQLGDGTTATRLTPINVIGLSNSVTAITAGSSHSCALIGTGSIKCWGDNGTGQVGDGTTLGRLTPVNVIGLSSGMTAIAAGSSHTCALTSAGDVKCWGSNFYGQLGDGTASYALTPTNVSGLSSGVTAIDAGSVHACALMSMSGVKCWGSNFYGQLGDGTTTDHLTPVDVSGLASGMTAIAVGGDHTCALTSVGGVKCWGANFSGQLGDGTTTQRLTPVNVSGLTSGVIAIVVGERHTCALTTTGGVKCWGANFSGQLGDGTTTQRLTPVNVSGLTSGVTAIAAGGDGDLWKDHTCALTNIGGVKCWGDNSSGQLGDGTTTRRLTPVNVNGLNSGVTAIAAGSSHTCASANVDGIKCWGDNSWGQLGDGTTTLHLTPVNVNGLSSSVSAVAAYWDHTCALTGVGGVKCWGANLFGQLGDSTTINRLMPVNVSGLTNSVTAIAAGEHDTCALTNGGIKCWGDNGSGQLGNGIPAFRTTPVDVVGLSKPDFIVNAIEVTQVIQDLNNSVPLIAGKRTSARVHVRNQGAASSAPSTARLCKDATCLMPSNPGGQIQILANPDRANLDQSFYFELPPDWLNGSYSLIATVNPPGGGQVEESDIFNNSMTRSIQFVDAPTLRLRLYNVRYGSGNAQHEADEFHLNAIESWLSRAYPISALDVRRSRLDFNGTPTSGAIGGGQVWAQLASEKAFNELFGEDPRFIYYGVVDDGGTVIRGIGTPLPKVAAGPTGNPADYPGNPNLSWDADGSFGDWYAGHEIGHTLLPLLAHAPCNAPAPVDPTYPYPNGVIGGPSLDPNRYYGFDIDTRAIYTPTWHDMMTYCPWQWISDYNYNRIRNNVPAQVMMTTRGKTNAGEYLIVAGSINLTQNTGSLDPLYRIYRASAPTPPITGTHVVKLLGASDTTLAEYPVTPSEDPETQPGEDRLGFISEVVPWMTGTQRIAIYSSTVELDSRFVSTNTPTVTILSPNGGEVFTNTAVVSWSASDADSGPLTYVVQYSADDGATWQAVGVGITSTQVYTLDLSLLPGGDQSRVQIIASDGVNTGIDASDVAFHVVRKLPIARILSPANNSHYTPGQTIILVGQGTDVEDGTLPDSSLNWRSDVSGILGTGKMLDVTELSPGKHVVTLTVTDSSSYTATASINIFAGAKIYLPLLRRNQ